ncbi:hypothetical protein D3C73_1197400 [compost metagenome]
MCADAIPLPLDLPGAGRAEQGVELFDGGLQGMRQKERVWLATTLAMFIGRFSGDQLVVTVGCRAMADVGIAHQALSYAFGIQPRQLRQCPGDQQLGHAHAKAASDQLQAQHQAGAIQLCPQWRQALLDLFGGQPTQWQQMGFDPMGQPALATLLVFRQQQRDGLRQVAHGLIAFFE